MLSLRTLHLSTHLKLLWWLLNLSHLPTPHVCGNSKSLIIGILCFMTTLFKYWGPEIFPHRHDMQEVVKEFIIDLFTIHTHIRLARRRHRKKLFPFPDPCRTNFSFICFKLSNNHFIKYSTSEKVENHKTTAMAFNYFYIFRVGEHLKFRCLFFDINRLSIFTLLFAFF